MARAVRGTHRPHPLAVDALELAGAAAAGMAAGAVMLYGAFRLALVVLERHDRRHRGDRGTPGVR